jgi:hypothetical protein
VYNEEFIKWGPSIDDSLEDPIASDDKLKPENTKVVAGKVRERYSTACAF